MAEVSGNDVYGGLQIPFAAFLPERIISFLADAYVYKSEPVELTAAYRQVGNEFGMTFRQPGGKVDVEVGKTTDVGQCEFTLDECAEQPFRRGERRSWAAVFAVPAAVDSLRRGFGEESYILDNASVTSVQGMNGRLVGKPALTDKFSDERVFGDQTFVEVFKKSKPPDILLRFGIVRAVGGNAA